MSSDTAAWYARAARELAPHSAVHASWADGVSRDEELLALVDRLPRAQRQPSLVFSVARWLGAPTGGFPALRSWMLRHDDELVAAGRDRLTQTNEVGRCAPLVAALATIPGPVALLEVGASAGLCLAPERYAYRFSGSAEAALGPSDGAGPLIDCRSSGIPPTGLALALPRVVWRRGIDLAPLRADDPDDARWLDALVPPDRPDRRARLRQALDAVRDDPPRVTRGDAVAALPDAIAAARSELAELTEGGAPAPTLVVVSLGTLVYLPPVVRAAFAERVRGLGARSVTLEGRAVLPEVEAALAGRSAPEPTPFVLAVDGRPLAFSSAHGDRLSWLSATPSR